MKLIDVKKYEKLTGNTIGAAMEVHKELGFGFLEKVYQRGLFHELRMRSIPFGAQQPVKVYYKGLDAGTYIPDFIVYDEIIVEIKALEVVNFDVVQAQIINYLVALQKPIGLYFNFGRSKLEFKRYIIPKKFQSVSICSKSV